MLDVQQLHGIYPPLVTPLTDEGDVDHASLHRLVDFVIDDGADGLWVLGTSGEFPAFSASERAAIVETVIRANRGRLPVVVNVGDAGTRLAIAHARVAQAAGADVLAAVPPYYFSNSQDELLAHFRAIRSAVDLPLLAYHFPQMVKVSIEPATLLQLAGEGTIVGLKDSQNDLDQFRTLVRTARARGLTLRSFVGSRMVDAAVAVGADGIIGAVGNVCPGLQRRCWQLAASGDLPGASHAQDLILKYGSVGQAMKGASRHSVALGTVKMILKARGILATSRLTAPLRSPTPAEEAEAFRMLADVDAMVDVR